MFVLEKNEFDDVIIPCRPTSPDLYVMLMKDGEEVGYYFFKFIF